MPSQLEGKDRSRVISPVLFMGVDGEPMRFYLSPGPAKLELQPTIKAGGGMVCNAQEPRAILLVDPSAVGSLTEKTAHWYVSAQYIRDCVEKNEQLELEDYRVKPNTTHTHMKTRSTTTGRTYYNSEEDTAIISYVAKQKGSLKGNRLWQEMEKKHVTKHSWQSMKYRYLNKLMDRPAMVQDGGSRNGESKMAENQETRVGGSSPKKQMASSSDDLTSSGLAQPDDQQPDDQQPDDQQPDDQQAHDQQADDQQADDQQADDQQADDQQTEDLPMEAGSSESTNIESPTASSFPDQDVTPCVTPKRRSHRLILRDTPPSDTEARTSLPCSSPKASTSAASSRLQPSSPPHQLTESNQSAGPTSTSDGGANPVTQKEVEKRGKRKAKRKLGFLEMATKEFEDDSESDYAETSDQPETSDTQHPRETTSKQPTAMPHVAMETRTAVETGSAPKPHLFIFDSESQEEGCQPMDCDDAAVPAGPAPISETAEVVSLNQAQLKEDMRRIRELMKQTNQDLVSVTKALLKTSGDFSAALALLVNPTSARGPFWSRRDDRLLLTSDPKAHRQLQKRYGEQGVAKRLVFLEGEL
ncbi:Telomeric repeat-binding factor 2-interacting protein 1 [Merluccius polli]|uniref:Telomeric repeat-binding factor 2-interacting protein 1 n=1 Tax=Merluccius polli TaxID=89951 RepID=A0AA47MW26_MERPO|nr:Telomeric repeat-binding factor 2-interacting protein 1 [Merluccius polli]